MLRFVKLLLGPGHFVRVTGNLQKIWDALIEDVNGYSCLGPCARESQRLRSWSAMIGPQRSLEVIQKSEAVRFCDRGRNDQHDQPNRRDHREAAAPVGRLQCSRIEVEDDQA